MKKIFQKNIKKTLADGLDVEKFWEKCFFQKKFGNFFLDENRPGLEKNWFSRQNCFQGRIGRDLEKFRNIFFEKISKRKNFQREFFEQFFPKNSEENIGQWCKRREISKKIFFSKKVKIIFREKLAGS